MKASNRHSDGKKPGEWESAYPKEARRSIAHEGAYLLGLLIVDAVAMLTLHSNAMADWVSDSVFRDTTIKYGSAVGGGLLGGTLFSLKWLYRAAANELWHLDRRYWRVLAPFASAGLAFAFVVVISSGLLKIFDPSAMESPALCFSVAFLVGLFSDSAMKKLKEVADTLFGTSGESDLADDIEKQPHVNQTDDDADVSSPGSAQ